MGKVKDKKIDHENCKKYDNRRENLRYVNNSTNGFNSDSQCNNTSGKVGVSYHVKNNCWTAQIRKNWKQIYLGSFKKYEDAVQARKQAEVEYFGELKKI